MLRCTQDRGALVDGDAQQAGMGGDHHDRSLSRSRAMTCWSIATLLK